MGVVPNDTPSKNRLIGTLELSKTLRERPSHNDIFQALNFSRRTGWRTLTKTHPHHQTFHNAFKETRGHKKLLSDEDLIVLKRFIKSDGFDSHTTPWEAMPAATSLDSSPSKWTIQQAIKTRNFRFYLACKKPWVSHDQATNREEYCRRTLEKYPLKEDWHSF